MAGEVAVGFSGASTGAKGMIDDITGIGSALSGLGVTATTVTAALGSLGAILTGIGLKNFLISSAKRAAQFQKAMRGVAVTAQLSQKEVSELGDTILSMSQRTPLAQEQLAVLAREAGRLGITSRDKVAEFVDVMQKMGEATILSAEMATEQLSKISAALGLPLDDVRKLGDSITNVALSVPANAREISLNMRKAAAGISESVTVSKDSLVAMSSTLNALGQQASRAGTRLRRVFQTLARPGIKRQVATVLGKSLEEVNQQLSQDALPLLKEFLRRINQSGNAAQTLARIFPSSARAALQPLANNIQLLEKLEKKSRMSAGTLDNAFQSAIENLQDQWTIFGDQIETVLTKVGQEILPGLTDKMKKLNEFIRQSVTPETVENWAKLAKVMVELANDLVTVTTFFAEIGGRGASIIGNLTGKIEKLEEKTGVTIDEATTLAMLFTGNFDDALLTVTKSAFQAEQQFGSMSDQFRRAHRELEGTVSSATKARQALNRLIVDGVISPEAAKRLAQSATFINSVVQKTADAEDEQDNVNEKYLEAVNKNRTLLQIIEDINQVGGKKRQEILPFLKEQVTDAQRLRSEIEFLRTNMSSFTKDEQKLLAKSLDQRIKQLAILKKTGLKRQDILKTAKKITQDQETQNAKVRQALDMLVKQGALSEERAKQIKNNKDLMNKLTDAAKQQETAMQKLTDTVKGFGDRAAGVFSEFVTTGSASIREFVQNAIGQLSELIFKLAVINPLMNAASSGTNRSTINQGGENIIGTILSSAISGIFGGAGTGATTGGGTGPTMRSTPMAAGDTPQVMKAPSRGAAAAFAPGDFVAASQSRQDLKRQVGEMDGGSSAQTIVVEQKNNFAVGVRGEVRAELRNQMPQIRDEAKRAVRDAKDRGQL